MSHIKHFAAYAAAFERAYENDDWSEVGSFFAADAVYEIGLPILGAERCEGRAAIVAWFKGVLDRFDRRFETRALTFMDGPKEEGNEVWIEGTATYTAEGVPDFALALTETIRFDGDETGPPVGRLTSASSARASGACVCANGYESFFSVR